MLVSIFNDVLGPVMRGPSSSHTAAALRIGRLCRDLLGGTPDAVRFEADRQGSLPTTHDGQGSDMGLCGGLLGLDAADERLPDAVQALAAAGAPLQFAVVDTEDPHPNTYRLTVRRGPHQHVVHAISTGGGMIEVIAVDGFPVALHGDAFVTLLRTPRDGAALAAAAAALPDVDRADLSRGADGELVVVAGGACLDDAALAGLRRRAAITAVHRLQPVLPVLTRRSSRVPFATAAAMQAHDAGRGTPLWQLAVDYERARGGLGPDAVLQQAVDLVRILRRSIAQGVAGTQYRDRILPAQTPRLQALLQQGRLLDGGALNRIVLYVSALMEVKSSLGVIVAAPTAGACAALPAAVIGMAETMGRDETAMARALLASGLVGAFIATAWTFAAEVGGCQAEGGAAACMAAAALVTLADGSQQQALTASSLALQSMLGLICDPVAGRVEVPCLGKNVMAASHALSCANLALADFDPVIPLDQVILACKRVAEQMPRELRCTALGGLAITPAAQAVAARLGGGDCGCGPGGCG